MISVLGVTDALKIIARRCGKSIAQICREMKMGTPANLVSMVNRGSMKMDVGAKFAKHCGYKLVLVPEDADITDGIEIYNGTEDYL